MADATPLFGGRLTGPLDFEAFVAACEDPMASTTAALADRVEHSIPIYAGDRVRELAAHDDRSEELRAEMADVLGNGSGVVVIQDAWPDRDVLDAMTETLWAIIERERETHDGFDHFAASGANSRAWDTLGKAAKLDPEGYVAYYANAVLDLVSTAWLGPWYQLTAQVNVVHPGGAAQSPHRDYHLGFLSDEDAARFPRHAHRLSQALTLQGAVAHTAMPVDAGPTMLLPGSQRFLPGYLAWRDERFRSYFADHAVQLPLEPGDAVFFNPGLHHAAGENRTPDHDRMGNLFQVSSSMGIAMEAIDWPGIATATYPALLGLATRRELEPVHLAVCASGYPWPSNLDTDVSTAGLAPPSLQDLLGDALARRDPPDRFAAAVAAKTTSRRPF